MGQTAFEACLNDEGLFKKIDAVRSQASQKFGITSTPTFFINGEKHSGEILPDALDATLAPFFK
jgi:protein-disulfide isomerase